MGCSAEDKASSLEDTERITFGLRNIAEKVGNEVEKYAEHLDSWRKLRYPIESLVKELRMVGETFVNDLSKECEGQHIERRRRSFSRKINPSSIDTEPEHQGNKNTPSSIDDVEKFEAWQDEFNTWRLFEDIVETRFARPASAKPTRTSLGADRFAADAQDWQDFLASNAKARDHHMAVKWLEEIAERDRLNLRSVEELVRTPIDKKTTKAMGWIDTRERVKTQKRERTWDVDQGSPALRRADGGLLVYHLDPDATTRLQRTLEFPDENSEKSFWSYCWELFRRGLPMPAIRSACEEWGQLVKASTVGAYVPQDARDDTHTDPITRFRWRSACCSAAHRQTMNEHERAVLGYIGGDFQVVEPVCHNWEDLYLAHCNALLLNQYMAYIRSRYTAELPPELLYKFEHNFASDIHKTSSQIMDSVKSHPLVNGTHQSEHAIIQQQLIGDNILGLLSDCGQALFEPNAELSETGLPIEPSNNLTREGPGSQTNIDSLSLLRTLAHIYIVLRPLGIEFPSPQHRLTAENILTAYIDVLILAGKHSVIPLYVSRLSTDRAPFTMAFVLNFVKDKQIRMDYLRLMKDNEFDVKMVLSVQYSMLAQKFQRIASNSPPFKQLSILERTKDQSWPGWRIQRTEGLVSSVDETEILMIEALEWHGLFRRQWFQAFGALNDCVLRFLASGRHRTATELCHRVDMKSLSKSKTFYILGRGFDIHDENDTGNGPPSNDNAAFPQSLLGSDSKSDEPEMDKETLWTVMKLQSSVYYEAAQLCHAIHTLLEFRRSIDLNATRGPDRTGPIRDESGLKASLNDVKNAMDPLLEPSFLTTPSPAVLMEVEQVKECLKQIREAYLPELVLGYIAVLTYSASTLSRDAAVDAIELASVIVDNEELTRCFTKTRRVRELVDALAASSKALLKGNENKNSTKNKRAKGPNKYAVWDIGT